MMKNKARLKAKNGPLLIIDLALVVAKLTKLLSA